MSIAPPVAGGIRNAFHIDGCQPFPEVSTLHELTDKQALVRDLSQSGAAFWEGVLVNPLNAPDQKREEISA